jgi:hypothetical protein
MLLNPAIFVSVFALFWFRPKALRSAVRTVEAAFGYFARHAALAILTAAAVPLLIRLCLLPVLPIPLPRIHDEFSYLLAADTFAHGRVTNPTHPLWEFFESFHVLQQPSYMSKYPPAQGLFMAAGQMLFGHPWWGVFLSVGLMCGAICWMLQAWLPGKWALLGALAVGLQFGVTHYWMNSYWGGAPAAIGGCLVLGAYGRLRKFRPLSSSAAANGLLLAVGAGILLNSRPWEGMTVMLPVAASLLYSFFLDYAGTFRRRFVSALIPCSLLLTITAASMLYYCWRITGNPLRLPYVAVHKTYSIVPLFVWQSSTPAPHYRHAVMQRFYTEWEPHYQSVDQLKTLHGWLAIQKTRLRMAKDVLFGNFFLLLCLACGLFLWRAPASRFLIAVLALFLAALSVEGWCQVHYFAPVIGLAAALKLLSLRRLACFRFRGRRVGQACAAAIILCSAVSLGEHLKPEPSTAAFPLERAAIERTLEAQPGGQVVLVRYSATHNPIQEWVYNHADIDAAKVVWARDMTPQEDRRLTAYFKDRHFWLLEPDRSPVDLRPYPELPHTIYSKALPLLPPPGGTAK